MVEMGGYVGYSAIRFGDALRRAGGKKYYSLEINPINASVAKMLIELAGLQDIITVIVAPSHEALAQLVQDGSIEQIEILFLDHWKDRYLYDLWFVERLGLLNKESVIVADNISPEAGRGIAYVDWLKATKTEKEEILKTHEFSDDFKDLDLAKLIKAKGINDVGVDLANVEGVPSYVYETEIHPFQGHSGRTVCFTLLCSEVILTFWLGWCCHYEGAKHLEGLSPIMGAGNRIYYKVCGYLCLEGRWRLAPLCDRVR